MIDADKPEQTSVNDPRTDAASDTPATRVSSQPVLGWTYFFQDSGLIKIGFSERPRHRIGQHRRRHPDLKILAIVPSSIAGEFETHQRFDHLREEGEMFRAEPELLAFIKRAKRAGAKISEPPVAGQKRGTASGLPVVADLHALRRRHGPTSAIGYHCSNLAEIIPAYQVADDPLKRLFLAASIRRQMTGLTRLRADLQ